MRLLLTMRERLPFVGLCLVAVAITLLLISACGEQRDTMNDSRGSDMVIELLAPNVTVDALSVRLTNPDGLAKTDARVSLEGNMNHAGMAPVFAGPAADGDDGLVDGIYKVPFAFTMLGDWIVTVSVEADAETAGQDFYLRVGTDSIELIEL